MDGYLEGAPPQIYKDLLTDIERWAEKVGRSMKEIEPAILLSTAVATDPEEARKFVEPSIREISLQQAKLLEKMGVIPPSYKFTQSSFTWSAEGVKEFNNKAKEIPFEATKARAIFGTPEDCIDQLEKYVKVGARHIIVRPQSTQPKMRERFLRSYAEKIIPHFRSL